LTVRSLIQDKQSILTEKGKKDAETFKLTGTTLRVYRYLYRMGKPCGIREIQRGLSLSSSSVALYHVRKLLDAGLIREETAEDNSGLKNGTDAEIGKGASGYVVDRMIYENMIRVRRSLIPLQVGYSMFFATALIILLVLLRPATFSGAYIFSLVVIAAACSIFAIQAYKSVSDKEI
jgi:DNA-binding Lrp family transcriptional regulator